MARCSFLPPTAAAERTYILRAACIYYRKNTRTGGKGHEKVHRDLRFLQGLAAEPRHLRHRARAYPLFFPACEVRALSVADGGEGRWTASSPPAAASACSSPACKIPTASRSTQPTACCRTARQSSKMAAAAGLPLVAGRKNPCVTTTYGVGQLIADALARGARRIVLGLGGSATNDGGCGCAAALGVRFTDAGGRSLRSRRRDARPHRAHRRLRRARKAARRTRNRHVRHHQSHARP